MKWSIKISNYPDGYVEATNNEHFYAELHMTVK